MGEFECKLDDKGRVVIPSGLKRQLPKDAAGKLVVNRGFEKCLTLFTRKDWNVELENLSSLNHFNKKHRMFVRQFSNGATEVNMDSASRILIPKKLSEYAEIENEAVFYAYGNRIEIWSKRLYEEMMAIDADDFADLAEDVMGDAGEKGGDDE
ncbi:division/cell wall cluster transcriptional repressor MraZ [bacterium]|nr:division/cell wall cluster transcriptional repressor MraZ [bacterium]